MTGTVTQKCPACGHRAHEHECTKLGPVTCQPVKTDSGTVLLRGRFTCGCTHVTRREKWQ